MALGFMLARQLQTCVLVWVLCGLCVGQVIREKLMEYNIDPLDMNSFEPYTDLTIDQIIMKAMGGIGPAQNLMLGEDGTVLAELDMRLTHEQYAALYEHPTTQEQRSRIPRSLRERRKAIREVTLRWPRGDVPYRFVDWHFDDKERYMMRAAMTEWEKYTCLKFREANSTDLNLVRFQNGAGCNSQLGMVGGQQSLNLDRNGCRFKGLYLHEIGHAIGLVHEHQLPSRDDYIEILYHNVQPNMRIWFNKYSSAEVDQMEVPYEYSSVMHYGITAFSTDGKSQTIRAKQSDKEKTIGRVYKKELSFTDIKTVNLMYSCAEHCSDSIVCNGGGFVDQNCKCICPDGTDNCAQSPQDQPKQEPDCFNAFDDWQCGVWSNQGECDRNPRFMLDGCKKACKLCGSNNDDQGTHITTWAWQWLCVFANVCPKNWTIGVCKDLYETSKCKEWKERGDCIVNKKWMDVKCKLTCNACDQFAADPETECIDAHSNSTECDKWAAEGECQINPDWMPSNCRRACHMCSKNIDTSDDTEDEDSWTDDDYDEDDDDNAECIDKHNSVECKGWADKDECMLNPDWMIPNCRKSCRKCRGEKTGEDDCKNIWDDQQCEGWERDRECLKNKVWMNRNCYKSCSKCSGDVTPDSEQDEREEERNRESEEKETNTDTGNSKCVNHHRNEKECDTWAKHGHCNINKWMLKHCAKACLGCGGEDTNSGTPTTPKPPKDTDDETKTKSATCFDTDDNCQAWADHGFCRNNPQMALKICTKACNACSQGADCYDRHQLCPVWQKVGQCQQNGGYMLRNCQKSCGVCNRK